MKYLLDTNICIRFLNGRAPSVREKLLALPETDIAISAVTKGEMAYGAARSIHPERTRAQQLAFFIRYVSLPYDDTAADMFGRIRAALEAAGTPIGPYDLQIAAIALVHGLIVVTHNTREFGRVKGLQIEDWEI